MMMAMQPASQTVPFRYTFTAAAAAAASVPAQRRPGERNDRQWNNVVGLHTRKLGQCKGQKSR